jgi:YfiH family protein
VSAASSTRLGGLSQAPFASLNLGDHVGDAPELVAANRHLLNRALGLPGEPRWLKQVHGCCVQRGGDEDPEADAAWSNRPGEVCVVMTADCLPVLLCDAQGTEVAAVHAGWRGLCDGVIEATLGQFSAAPGQLLAWLGPAIGPDAFEVGPEVRAAFLAKDADAALAFRPGAGNRWLADIFLLARQRLNKAGVHQVFGGGLCTYNDPQRFFSYRRDGVTGRMATLIWLEESCT